LTNTVVGYLRSSLRDLSIIHNFTIESQVQYHAPLAFEPHVVMTNTTIGDNDENLSSSRTSYHLDQDHIKTFVNSEEWTLGK
jgi:GPI-anchor transamidase subunit S